MIPGTYEIKNKLDGMAYGGSSGQIEHRWKQHRSMLRNNRHHCEYFQNAWNKYGEDVFEFRVLEVIEDPDERKAAEQKWLDIHHANKTCYNIATTAGPAGPMAEETKRKIADAKRGKKLPPHTKEWKQANSERMMGNQYALGSTRTDEERREMRERVVSDATRSKMSKSHKGKKHTDEHNRNKSKSKKGELNPMWGKHHTPAAKQKIRAAHVGKQYALGCTHSEEANQLKSERVKLWWAEKKAARTKPNEGDEDEHECIWQNSDRLLARPRQQV